MGTYRSTPGKFKNGTNHVDAKTVLDAADAKKRRETLPYYVFRDPWRERHLRRRPPDQQPRTDEQREGDD